MLCTTYLPYDAKDDHRDVVTTNNVLVTSFGQFVVVEAVCWQGLGRLQSILPHARMCASGILCDQTVKPSLQAAAGQYGSTVTVLDGFLVRVIAYHLHRQCLWWLPVIKRE